MENLFSEDPHFRRVQYKKLSDNVREWQQEISAMVAEQLPKEATPAIPPEATRLRGMLDCVNRHPDRFIAGWAPDPRHPHARLMLAQAVRQHGVRVLERQIDMP